MTGRNLPRYEEPRRTREPRDTRDTQDIRPTRDSRNPRDARDINTRDGPSPREMTSPRDGHDVGENRVDSRTETRIEPPRMEAPRMETSRMETSRMEAPRMDTRPDQRLDPRTDLRPDPRILPRHELRGEGRGEPRPDRPDIRLDHRDMRDPRDVRELRGEPTMDNREGRHPTSREAREGRDPRDTRDAWDSYGRDEMDIDTSPPERLTQYFLPGDGISREVIQADICRYLGSNATCLAGRNREGVPGYMIKGYRMLTPRMVEDLKADSKRWDDELRRTRPRDPRPVYADNESYNRRQTTGLSSNTSGFPPPSRNRDREDHDMDDYGRSALPSQRSHFPTSMSPDYTSYPVTSGPFSPPPMTAQPEYILARGQPDAYGRMPPESYGRGVQSDVYGQIPRSLEFEPAYHPVGRGVPTQLPNPGPFAGQQGLQPHGGYDSRTGPIGYPSAPAGRGFDQGPARHPNPGDGRRRM